MSKRLLIISIAVLLAAGGGAIALNKRSQTQARAAAAVAVTPSAPTLEFLPTDIAVIGLHDLRQTLPLSGSLRAVSQVAVKAKIAGEVREVLVREGEPVKAGQVLVRMDTREYQARLDQAKGALQAARGQLDIAVKARDNNQALLAKGFISQTAFDNTASQYGIAVANVDSATGVLDVAQKALADTVIHAPISGLVSSRTIQPGEKVSADNRLLDVVDLQRMEMEAAVPTSEIMRIAQGQEVQVSVEGLAQPLPGKVVRINPAIQSGSRSILVYVQIENPQLALRVGMFGDAQLTLSKKSGVLTVPPSAIQTEAGNTIVYAIENNKLVQKPVKLGVRGEIDEPGHGAAIEILEGVEDGTQIVANNLGNLRPGSSVRIAKPASQKGNAPSAVSGRSTSAAASAAASVQ
jgi:RND family efflux transporter MFP subunit